MPPFLGGRNMNITISKRSKAYLVAGSGKRSCLYFTGQHNLVLFSKKALPSLLTFIQWLGNSSLCPRGLIIH